MTKSEVYLLYNTNASDIQLYHGSSNKESISNCLEYEDQDEFTILYGPGDDRNYTDIKIVSRTKLKNRPQSADSFVKTLKHNVEGVIVRRTSSFSSIEELYLLKKCPVIRPLLSETEILTLQKLQEECKNQRQESFGKRTEVRKSRKPETKGNVRAIDFALPNMQALDAPKTKDFKRTRITSPYDKQVREALASRPTTEDKQPKEKPIKKTPKTILNAKPENKAVTTKYQGKSKQVKEPTSGMKKGSLKPINLDASKKVKSRKEKDSITEIEEKVRKKDGTLSKKGKENKNKQFESSHSKTEEFYEEGGTEERRDKLSPKQTRSAKMHKDKSIDTGTTTTKINKDDERGQSTSNLKKGQSKSTGESLTREKKAQRKSDTKSPDSSEKSSHVQKKVQRKSDSKSADLSDKSLRRKRKNLDEGDEPDSYTKKERSIKHDLTLEKTDEKSLKLHFSPQEEKLKTPVEKSGTETKNKSNKEKDKKLKNLYQYMIQYVLSDRKFLQLGWTIKPTDKSQSRLVIFKALPANPQTYVFRDHEHKETKHYDSGKVAISMELDGTGRINYPEGSPAVVITKHEKCKRLVIHSNPKKDPLVKESFHATILGIFDSFGNAEVYDSKGNKVLCYNQLEGFYKNSIKNTTYKWKWNAYETLKQRQIKEILNSMVEDVNKSASPKNRQESKLTILSGSVGSKKPVMEKKTTVDRIYESVVAELPQPTATKSAVKNDMLPTNFKSIILKINQEMTLRINGQDKVCVTYVSEKCFYKIDIGLVIDPDIVESIDELKGDKIHSLPCIFNSVLHPSPSLQNLCLPKY